MKNSVRTRFAPAPTGLMHLGNIRTALMNYLFARQKGGSFIVRIEDTDPQRNFDPEGKKILEDLTWLGLTFDEGPRHGGPYAPYIQSQRMALYQEKLEELAKSGHVYRCFCTAQELDKKRQRQIALKMPPRYDRTCSFLKQEEIDKNLADAKPFIWRLKLDHEQSIVIKDMGHNSVEFQLKNFSDFPLTRQNGTFTFMFANCVDDIAMKITHVFRGEDHLTNTAGQAALYYALGEPLPIYWHMPILCNTEGRKLSKRDFGFSLNDLRQAGYLPQALCNYLGIIGGGTFEHEVMSLQQLTQSFDFEHTKTTGHVRYDTQKLTWINHKWIERYEPMQLTERCLPFLQKAYAAAKTIDKETLSGLLQTIKSDISTLKDSVIALHFYFLAPEIGTEQLLEIAPAKELKTILQLIQDNLDKLNDSHQFVEVLKQLAKENGIGFKSLFSCIRLGLMGRTKGPTIHDLIAMLGADESATRLTHLVLAYND